MPIALDRLALGPRERGRGYGVIAATPGLTLPGEALAAVEDFNLRIGDHVAAGREIHACFRISMPPSRELWFVSTTVVHGREAGNVVWVTWGVVLDRQQMTALDARPFRLFGLLEGPRKPKVGEDLPALEIEPEGIPPLAGEAPGGLDLARRAGHLGRTPLFIEVHEPMAALATLEHLMDCVTVSRREEISFASAPIPLRAWDLIVFQHESWANQPKYATGGAEPVRIDGNGVTGGKPVSVANLVWDALAHLVAERADLGGGRLEREIVAQHRLELDKADDLATIEARLRGVIGRVRVQEGEAAAVPRMGQLLGAASQLPGEYRKPAAIAMLAAWEDMFGETKRPLEWFTALQSLGPAVHRRLDVPELLLPRIAAENRLVLSLEPQAAEAMGDPLTTIFRDLLLEQSVQSAEGRPETALTLLAQMLPRLVLPGPQLMAEWNLANDLCRRTLGFADSGAKNGGRPRHEERISKILIEFLETVVTMRRADGIETMFQPESRRKLQLLLGGDFQKACRRTRSAALALLETASAWSFAFAVERRVRP